MFRTPQSSRLSAALALATGLGLVACQGDTSDLVALPETTALTLAAPTLQETQARVEPLLGAVTGSGTVEPARAVMLTSPYPARIEAVDVVEGQRVEEGERVVQLDTTAQRQQMAQATAGAAAQRAQARQAAAEVARLTPLVDAGVVPAQQVDQIAAQRVALDESVAASEAIASLMRAQRADGAVKAPFVGTITQVMAEIGDMGMPGMPLVRLVDMSEVDVRVTLSEADMMSIRVGDTMQLKVIATGVERQGRIRFVDPELDQQTRFGRVIVRVDNADGALMAGAYVQVEAERREGATVVVVDSDALLRTATGTFVYVVSGSSRERRPVQVDRLADGRWSIVEGLRGGERLLSGNLARLGNAPQAVRAEEGTP